MAIGRGIRAQIWSMESASPRRWPDPSRPLPLRVATVLLLAAFQLVGGAVYAFSSVASGLTRLGFGQLIPVAAFGIAANVGTFVCVHNGFFLDRVGALRSQLVSMVCIVLGYGVIALLAGPGGGGSPLADVVAVLAFLVVGQGGVMGFLAAISHAEGLFPPARRGLVVGTILAGFGVSGGFSAAVFHALDGQVPAYCVFLIAETVVLGSVVAACIHGTLRAESHTGELGVSPRRDAAAAALPPSHVSPPRSGPCSLLRTVIAAARDAFHGTVGLLWLAIFLQAGPFLMVVNTLANIVQSLASASSSSSSSSANDSLDEGRILRDAVLAFALTNTSLRIVGGWVTDELARNADWLVHGCGSGLRRARRRRGPSGPSGPSRRTDAERAEERARLEDAGGGYAEGEVTAAELEGGAGVGDDEGGGVVDETEAIFVRQRAIRGRLVLLIVAAVLAVAALAVLGTTEPTGLVPRVMVGAALIGCAEGLCFAAWPTILRDEEDALRGAAARRRSAPRQASPRSAGVDEGAAVSAVLSSTTRTSGAPIDGLPRHGFVSRFGVQFALVDSAIGFGSLTFVSVAAAVYRWHRVDGDTLCAGRACFADGVWVALASSVLALVPIACLWFDLGTAFSSSTASERNGDNHCSGRLCGFQARGSFAVLGSSSSSSTSSSSSSSTTGAVRDVEVTPEVRLDDEDEDETEDAPSLAVMAGGADRSLPPSTPMQLQSSRRVPLVLSGGREGEDDGGHDDGELEGVDGPVAWQHIPPVGMGEEEDDGDVEYRFGRGRLVLSPTDADGES